MKAGSSTGPRVRLTPPLLQPTSRLESLIRTAPLDRQGQAQIGRRQVYILPTGFGVTFAGALFLMFLGSINYMNNLGLLFTFLLSGLALVAMVHTWRNLLGLQVRVAEARPVFAGEMAVFPVRIADPRQASRPGLTLAAGPWQETFELEAQAHAGIPLEVATRQRGEYRLGRARMETRFPLGLFRAWACIESPARVLVYPNPAPRAPESVPEAGGAPQGGTGGRGSGVDDFAGLRDYRRGDAMNRLYWKAVARERGFLVKQFDGDRAEELWLDWAQLPPGDSEGRLSLLCRQVLDADARGVCYGLRLPGQTLDLDRGLDHRHRCLRALALFDTHEAV